MGGDARQRDGFDDVEREALGPEQLRLFDVPREQQPQELAFAPRLPGMTEEMRSPSGRR